MVAAVWLVLMVVAFYALLVRPQRRQLVAHRALVAALEVGDEVITSGGIYGRITALEDAAAELEIAPGTVIRVARSAVAQRVTEPEVAGPDD